LRESAIQPDEQQKAALGRLSYIYIYALDAAFWNNSGAAIARRPQVKSASIGAFLRRVGPLAMRRAHFSFLG
jgi:hypothetical protein